MTRLKRSTLRLIRHRSAKRTPFLRKEYASYLRHTRKYHAALMGAKKGYRHVRQLIKIGGRLN